MYISNNIYLVVAVPLAILMLLISFKLCCLRKFNMSYKLMMSSMVMFSLMISFSLLFLPTITSLNDIIYFFVSGSLFIFTFLTHEEPELISYIIAVILWFLVLLSPLYIKSGRKVCIFIIIYTIINIVLGWLILVGRSF